MNCISHTSETVTSSGTDETSSNLRLIGGDFLPIYQQSDNILRRIGIMFNKI